MAIQAKTRRYWPLAVTASVLLHAGALFGLALIAGGAPDASLPPATQLISFDVAEIDSDHASFIEASEPPAGMDNRPKKNSGEPEVVATLHNPLESEAPAVSGESSGAGSETATGEVIGGVPGGAATSFFQIGARGKRIVYIIDGSASMSFNDALRTACAELKASVRKLPAGAKFQIIVYNDHASVLIPRYAKWLDTTPEMIREVEDRLDQQVAQGSTEHEQALRQAFYLEPDVVFFLTDADDLEPKHVSLIAKLNNRHATVNTIELNTRNRHRTDMPLQRIARLNQGTYQAVDLNQPRQPAYPSAAKAQTKITSAP